MESNIYEEIFGLAMGSPLSPLLPNVYMNKIEEKFKMAPLQLVVLMWYLDDYFAIWSHGREKLEEFLKFVNHIDGKFTMEIDKGERLPFLDVEAEDWNNEEHDHPKPTPNGCRILGRGAGQIDEDIPRQWLP
ncbi:unnamed protein product [Protopolystoma xenopodis]|uniref:Reverse transcriptase domain-containing protein n=1 Tax=Protopolystoma xenopodis TaxID=117903 RepID=A0A448WKK0_9PLAT|nr:unnamed protein product [Protopolystoma xenopodis]